MAHDFTSLLVPLLPLATGSHLFLILLFFLSAFSVWLFYLALKCLAICQINFIINQ